MLHNLKSLALNTILSKDQAFQIATRFGTPIYIQSQPLIEKYANETLSMPNFNGLTVRQAMKSNFNASILKIIKETGVKIDAGSFFEVRRALLAGQSENEILLTSKLLPFEDQLFIEAIKKGLQLTASSLQQLARFGELFPGHNITFRMNSGIGSGERAEITTGGPSAPFGIWHQDLEEAIKLAKKNKLQIDRLYSHIGAGNDPKMWLKEADKNLKTIEYLLKHGFDVKTLNMGGGFKVRKKENEESADMQYLGKVIKEKLARFAQKTKKMLHFEIEPGKFLLQNAGCLLGTVIDVKRTSDYNFLILNAGVNEFVRPKLLGFQYSMELLNKNQRNYEEEIDYVVCGPGCASQDIFTVNPSKTSNVGTRKFKNRASIGDLFLIEGAGAYASTLSLINFNSFPQAPELLITSTGEFKLIRKRQTIEEMIQNEVSL